MGDCRSADVAEADQERISELFHVLSDRRRRYAIYCLCEYENPMALADLADEIVRLETDTAPTTVPEIRDQVYTHLYHRHLPKLAEADLVRFDINKNLVSLGDAAADVKPYLHQIQVDKWPPNA